MINSELLKKNCIYRQVDQTELPPEKIPLVQPSFQKK